MVEGGDSETVTQNPAHPYTQLLISSAPDPDRIVGEGTPDDTVDASGGEPPSLIDPPAGCRFNPRCPHAMDICRTELPPRFPVNGDPGHWASCWLFDAEHGPTKAPAEVTQ
nr:oligopeptide/dipeptide ABC transporter ATP-binding protein [Streptomyces sp. 846.5]